MYKNSTQQMIIFTLPIFNYSSQFWSRCLPRYRVSTSTFLIYFQILLIRTACSVYIHTITGEDLTEKFSPACLEVLDFQSIKGYFSSLITNILDCHRFHRNEAAMASHVGNGLSTTRRVKNTFWISNFWINIVCKIQMLLTRCRCWLQILLTRCRYWPRMLLTRCCC